MLLQHQSPHVAALLSVLRYCVSSVSSVSLAYFDPDRSMLLGHQFTNHQRLMLVPTAMCIQQAYASQDLGDKAKDAYKDAKSAVKDAAGSVKEGAKDAKDSVAGGAKDA